MSDSLISCDIDLDTDGARHGYLRVPHSTHHSAYGWIPVPISVIKNGEGPTILMLAGVHGDEYEGQIALSRLACTLHPAEIRGRVILLPAANAPAAEAGLRVSPIDDGNLNRLFPGNPTGSPTQMIAHYIEEVLLPGCDVLVDLHSGGTSLYYPPTVLRGLGHSPQETRLLRDLQDAFDLPYAWIFTSGGGPGSTARTAMGAANRKAVVPIMAELGGGAIVTPAVLEITERGIRRVLHRLDMLPGYTPDAVRGTRPLHAQGLVYAYDAGVFEPFKDIADPVEAGAVIGQIHKIGTPADPTLLTSPFAGIVLCKRAMAKVARGDALLQIARDADRT